MKGGIQNKDFSGEENFFLTYDITDLRQISHVISKSDKLRVENIRFHKNLVMLLRITTLADMNSLNFKLSFDNPIKLVLSLSIVSSLCALRVKISRLIDHSRLIQTP